MKSRILLVDDHPLFRQGLATLIGQEPWCGATLEAGDTSRAMTLCETESPDLMVLDLSLGETNTLGFLKDLHGRLPDMAVLVVSMHDETMYAQRVLKAGALGYIMKSAPPDEILKAVRQVLNGKRYLSPAMEVHMESFPGDPSGTGPRQGLEALTDRELEVLRLVGQGFGTREIARMLNLSVKTVDTHREHMKVKLNLDNARELRRYALSLTGL